MRGQRVWSVLGLFLIVLAAWPGVAGPASAGIDNPLGAGGTAPAESGVQLPPVDIASSAWVTETVDGPRGFADMGPRSLALDGAGHPHIAYGGYYCLYHAWHDGTAWHTEVVDDSPGNVGWYTSLALDAAGRPHISYAAAGRLKYAYHDGAAWHSEVVDDTAGTGGPSSLVVDAAGHPHISYSDGDAYLLRYAYHDGTAWVREVVDSTAHVRSWSALALDAGGRPRIAYSGLTALWYARYDGTAWQIETIDAVGTTQHASLALDAAEHPHVGYLAAGGALKYAHYDGSAWQVEEVGVYGVRDPSLALDAAGRPAISYGDSSSLRYAHYDGAAWQFEEVDAAGAPCAYTALALDAAGRPAISYHVDLSPYELRLARHDGTAWQIETADRERPSSTGDTALALDSSGRPHLAYRSADHLVHAYHDGTAWQIDTTNIGEVGAHISLALDAGDHPHVSYFDSWNGDLEYAYYDGLAWMTQTVDSAGSVGGSNSLALDTAGRPHISYYDSTHDDLRYAYYDGSTWLTQTVDSAGYVGQGSSLAVDSLGRPHISYIDDTNDDLRYARYDGSAWITETVDTWGTIGGYTSLALDAFDRPHIAYQGYDGNYHVLRYASCDGAAWQIEVVDQDMGSYGPFPLVLDALDWPHIGYRDERAFPSPALTYTYNHGAGWVRQRVGHPPEAGGGVSLALDAAARAHLGYADDGRIGYAYQADVVDTCRARLNDDPTDYFTVQAAVDASTLPTDVVKVAGTCSAINDYGGHAQVVYLDKTLTVQGGYTLTNWTDPDPAAHPTTLDALRQGRVLYITGAISPVLVGLRITGGDATAKGGQGGGIGDPARLVSVTAAFSDANPEEMSFGGGVYALSATVTLSDSQILGNVADVGGGLYLLRGRAVLSGNAIHANTGQLGGGLGVERSTAEMYRNRVFSNTTTYESAGGVFIYENWAESAVLVGNSILDNSGEGVQVYMSEGPVTLISNTISGNTGAYAGGIFLDAGDCLLERNVISGNSGGEGGGVQVRSGRNVTLAANVIISNTAESGGGGAYLTGDSVTLMSNTITGNLTGYGEGGGVYVNAMSMILTSNLITGNVADFAGGGASLWSASAEIGGNVVLSNTADYGGGLLLYGSGGVIENNIIADNQARVAGSGLYLSWGPRRLLHNTIARNRGGDGSGIYVGYGLVVLTDTILVSQTVGITVSAESTAVLEGTLWGSGVWANESDWGGEGPIVTGTVNLWADPAFVDYVAGDYHVRPDSPAVDAGVESGGLVDVDGDARPAGPGYDIGADEQPGPALRLLKAAQPFLLNPGDVLTYTLLVSSVGAMPVSNVRFTDTLPLLQQALAITTTRGTCAAGPGWGGVATCDLGTMASGEQARMTLTAAVTTVSPAYEIARMRNVAVVRAEQTLGRTATAETILHDCRVRLNDSLNEYAAVQPAVDASTRPTDVVRVAGYCIDAVFREGITQVVYLSKTLEIEGGWNMTFTQRDATSYPTTLDALGWGRVLYATGEISLVLDGLRIVGGRAPFVPYGSPCIRRGGAACVVTATITVSDSQVLNSWASETGGGLAVVNGGLTLVGSVLSGNESSDGGGIYLDGSPSWLSENTFVGNAANWGGGGAYQRGGTAVVEANWIISNTAHYGAGLYLDQTTAVLDSNTITANVTDHFGSYGGGLYVHGGDITLHRNVITANHADGAGGVCMYEGHLTLERNVIVANEAQYGGGTSLFRGSATLDGNLIAGNISNDGGGLLAQRGRYTLTNNIIADNRVEGAGGGLLTYGSTLTLTHNTFARNRGGDGSGICAASTPAGSNVLTLVDNILVSHTVGIIVTAGSTVTLEATLWGSGPWGNGQDWGGAGTIVTGTVNVWGDPAFVDYAAGNYHIGAASAARDSGVDAGVRVDIDGEPRPAGPAYDIGADELWAALGVTQAATPDPVAAGTVLTYTLRVTNAGYLTLTAAITDVLPAQVTPTGALTWTALLPIGGDWARTFTVTVAPGYAGPLVNEVRVGTPEGARGRAVLTVTAEVPVAGLDAVNDSPTALGQPTTLTATVTAGTDLACAWDPGDGSPPLSVPCPLPLAPSSITHTYPAVGTYTAVVTAANRVSVLTATTVVQVEEAIAGLDVVNDSPTALGQPTTLTATVAAGSDVTYTWAFGDGTAQSASSPLPAPPRSRGGWEGAGDQGGRSVITHTYPFVGTYTAVVTASNAVSTATATTVVTIQALPAGYRIYLPLVRR